MKIETILNASNIAYARYCYVPEFDEPKFGRRTRQHRAFRARILRMSKEKDITLNSWVTASKHQDDWIDELRTELAEKDAEIYMLTEDLEKESP